VKAPPTWVLFGAAVLLLAGLCAAQQRFSRGGRRSFRGELTEGPIVRTEGGDFVN
jgi:hypothetical protein